MINELMVDIETTGTEPGCKVLTIGASGFNKNSEYVEFYVRFDNEKLSKIFSDESDTMTWWRNKSNEAYAEAFGGTEDPTKGLANFKQWVIANFSTGKFDKFKVWAKGIDFDFPILKSFMRTFGFTLPWQFYQQYDYRTIANLFPVIKNSEENAMKHGALEDAKAQMRGLRAFYSLTKD